MRYPVLMISSLLLLSGCDTAPTRSDADPERPVSVEQAVSRQTPVSDERKRAKVHSDLGRAYMFDGRLEVALSEAKIALEAENGYAPAHNLLGLIYMSMGQNDMAEKSFRDALGLAAGDPEINNDYGWFLCMSGRARESIVYFKQAFGNPLFQSPGKALVNAGVCSLEVKDDRQAEDFLMRAIRLDRANSMALFWLADIAYRSGRAMEARQRIKGVHDLIGEPTAETAWLALRIERKLGDRENEARYMGILRRKYRDSAEYLKMSRGEYD